MLWSPQDGRLKAAKGFGPSPRWAWQRIEQASLRADVPVATIDDLEVTAEVEWTPAPGVSYVLAPNADADAALTEVAHEPLRNWSRDLSFACFFAGLTNEDCPENPAREAAAQLTDLLAATSGGRLSVEFSAPATTIRSYLARGVRASLPEQSNRVLVFGLDALDWDFVDPLIASGGMPNLKRLVDSGTSGRMQTLVPILSPLIWTSVATGVSPDEHGVLDFVERDPATNLMLPVSARSRRAPAVWEMASVLGKQVAVTAWWATWPATEVNGTLVSDRLYYTLTQGIDKAVFQHDPEHLVYPMGRTHEFTALRDRAVRETGWQATKPFIDVTEVEFDAAVDRGLGMEDPIDGFRRILASTRTYMAAGLVLAAEKPDLQMVYLEGTDTIGHLLARYQPPPVDADVSAEDAARYAEAIPRYYQATDRWVGRFLSECPLSECTWIVVSDHGFKWGSERPRGLGGFSGRTAPLWHAEDAAFVVAGAGSTRRGRMTETASIYDIAPTVAAALGIPADESWSGELLAGSPAGPDLPAVDYSGLTVLPAEQVGGDVVAEEDPEFIAKLQALGYLAGEADVPPQQATTPPDSAPATDEGEPRTRGELNNLGVLKINEKKYDEAESILRQAIELSPEYPSPHYNLRRMYMEQGRHEDADRELWIAVDKGLRSPERSLDQAAADYDGLEMPERSAAILREAMRRYPDHEPFPVHLMVVLIRLQQCQEGQEVGRVASERFRESAPVHAFYGLSAACAGDTSSARGAVERSLELNPNQPRLEGVLQGLMDGR